ARRWQHAPAGAAPDAIARLLDESGLPLPPAYLVTLRWSDGPTGELPSLPYRFQLWPAAQVMEQNAGYELARWVPGFFGIGSSGGGELIAFDTRQAPPWPVCAIPWIPLDEQDMLVIAPDFMAFLALTGQAGVDG
ncbi:MAG TPA: SMI1/KNR4 family protein, partial [Herpetosiphonaceae bacterium]